MQKASDHMIGGTHYKNEGVPDHWDIVYVLGWDYFVAAAVKYLWRLGKKGGPEKAIEDISKSIHYLEKKRELMIAELEDGGVPGPGYVNQDR